MNTVRKDIKSDTHNETDMTEVQYKNITDQAQGTGDLLGIINARLIQMDVNTESRRLEVKRDTESRRLEVKRDIEKSVARVEESIARVEESVAQVAKRVTRLEESVKTLGLKTEQDIKELGNKMEQGFASLKTDIYRSQRLTMIFTGTLTTVVISLATLVVFKLLI